MRLGGKRRSSYSSGRAVQWLVVGLGNPGATYAGTPHNIGFDVVDSIAEQLRIPWIAKHDGLYGTGAVGDVDIALLKPLTYMNLSGRSVRPAQKSLDLKLDQLLVVHDEIDLPLGSIQIKIGGGLAGHNGLKSINEVCGGADFVRVRVGVGRPEPGDRRPIRDWILQPFDPVVDVVALRDDAARAALEVITRGPRAAMNAHNGSQRGSEDPS